mmetsp:Transcript_16897/g.23515  ORF Transcript_16897/g.23515 Transcript_16897/m.23515 type:complete len:626 (+) Transcript_16897:40-1917(+)
MDEHDSNDSDSEFPPQEDLSDQEDVEDNASDTQSQKTIDLSEVIAALESMETEWLSCFCVVDFDIELGPKIEYAFPSIKFSSEDKVNISFLSFPDTNTNGSQDMLFSFKHKRISNPNMEPTDTSSPNPENSSKTNTDYFGYVYFRQQKDPSKQRGYMQKSVVLLTDHGNHPLYERVIHIVAPLFFQFGTPLIEAAFQNISTWPPPKSGERFELPLLGNIIQFEVPSSVPIYIGRGLQNRNDFTAKRYQSLVNFHGLNQYLIFQGIHSKLWALWELVLTAQPILVMANSPHNSSHAVNALVSLISPLQYGGVYRPYFTIHDTDFNRISQLFQSNFSANGKGSGHFSVNNNTEPLDTELNYIIGATNPFFLKAWSMPHIISISQSKKSKHGSEIFSNGPSSPGGHYVEFKSKYKSLIKFNKTQLLDLIKSSDSPRMPDPLEPITNTPQNDEIRKYFLQITQMFLTPLERYFATLLPAPNQISLFKRPPRLKDFVEEDFISQVMAAKKPILGGTKTNEVELYRRFIHSPNFQSWFQARRREATYRLNLLYQRAIIESPLKDVTKSRKEVELIDLYLKIKEQMAIAKAEHCMGIHEQLTKQLDVLLQQLPSDLKDSIQVSVQNECTLEL